MKKVGLFCFLILILGCARLSVESTKPIQVDINMRVDIYQHVVKDVEDINEQIYGPDQKSLNFLFGTASAYAADDSGNLQGAIARRKERLSAVEEYFAKGYVGENAQALLELRPSAPETITDTVEAENADRLTIYKATAAKNGTDLANVQKVFFQKDYERAVAGYWFQTQDGWVQK